MNQFTSFLKTIRLLSPRLLLWIIFGGLGLFAMLLIAPAQIPVVLYKFALLICAAVVGYWLDRSVYPYARPDSYLVDDWRHPKSDLNKPHFVVIEDYHFIFAVTMLRRALIMFAVILGVSLGL